MQPGPSALPCRWSFPGLRSSLHNVCHPDSNNDIGIHLPTEGKLQVSTPYTLSVAPGTDRRPGEHPGLVQSQGGGCGQFASPFVALYETAGTTQTVVYSWAQSGSGADWQASLVVPRSGLMAGRYRLEADCDYPRGAIYGSDAPLEITIERRRSGLWARPHFDGAAVWHQQGTLDDLLQARYGTDHEAAEGRVPRDPRKSPPRASHLFDEWLIGLVTSKYPTAVQVEATGTTRL